MKILILSDIHGAYYELLTILKKEAFDRLIILGDLLPYGYYYENNNEDILELISKYKDKLILIEGNCDRYINYEPYNIRPIEIITMHLNNKLVTLTHGNKYKKGFLPEYHGDILICGHTHIPIIEKEKNMIYANPGSISFPKGGSYKSYLIFDNDKLILKTIDDNIIKELKI